MPAAIIAHLFRGLAFVRAAFGPESAKIAAKGGTVLRK
jgi:hypothetical protein